MDAMLQYASIQKSPSHFLNSEIHAIEYGIIILNLSCSNTYCSKMSCRLEAFASRTPHTPGKHIILRTSLLRLAPDSTPVSLSRIHTP
jgi:hypothetical protein